MKTHASLFRGPRAVRVLAMSLLLLLLLQTRWALGQEHHDMAAMQAPAAATRPAAPAGASITLSTDVEDHVKHLVATVESNGKPVEGAKVSFGARRLFGIVDLGHDTTLDDGTVAIVFPSDLPGDDRGMLEFVVDVTGPTSVAGARFEQTLPGGQIRAANPQPFPRALWSPHAPVGLIVVIVLILAGAWGAYAYVVAQLFVIGKGANA